MMHREPMRGESPRLLMKKASLALTEKMVRVPCRLLLKRRYLSDCDIEMLTIVS